MNFFQDINRIAAALEAIQQDLTVTNTTLAALEADQSQLATCICRALKSFEVVGIGVKEEPPVARP